mmetsp:Transcript_40626/g.61906  ORF Transcript_40626/g.61906 Transcript_40626/m.61906 type:complete len:262 (+) Transcript_40626:874-1659(+)|eukprot:CAMPEP_0170482688 /NCGR_PEP_ID=MMETSP0208-20121228/2593_1 /TAXON_ID=197538 /ORGANISM="Strombidium inclinatum, Strain S3" /LENGTH=261 /DNA_ID=CAMNT_0010755549 /DNA_START=873 /DNA_END=1658 /DNA_ORIENTATION=-
MVMGIVYLMYAAYFLATDIESLSRIVNGMLAILYLVLGIYNYKAIEDQIKSVKDFLINNEDADRPQPFQASIRLKLKMLRQYCWACILFYAPMFYFFIYSAVNSTNEFGIQRLMAFVQLFESFVFIFILWIFRPRKRWPEYFSIGLEAVRADANSSRGARPAVLAPIKTASITDRLLLGFSHWRFFRNKKVTSSFASSCSFDSFGSMGVNEEVIIVNPGLVTVAAEDNHHTLLEISEQPDEEAKESLQSQMSISLASRDKD